MRRESLVVRLRTLLTVLALAGVGSGALTAEEWPQLRGVHIRWERQVSAAPPAQPKHLKNSYASETRNNWSTPFVWEHAQRTEIVTSGSDRVRSYAAVCLFALRRSGTESPSGGRVHETNLFRECRARPDIAGGAGIGASAGDYESDAGL